MSCAMNLVNSRISFRCSGSPKLWTLWLERDSQRKTAMFGTLFGVCESPWARCCVVWCGGVGWGRAVVPVPLSEFLGLRDASWGWIIWTFDQRRTTSERRPIPQCQTSFSRIFGQCGSDTSDKVGGIPRGSLSLAWVAKDGPEGHELGAGWVAARRRESWVSSRKGGVDGVLDGGTSFSS